MSDGKKMAGALDWKSVATWQHLFAATMAAHDLKVSAILDRRFSSLYSSIELPALFSSCPIRLSKITAA